MREDHERKSRNNGLGCSKCSHVLVFSSHPLTPPLNNEDPSSPSSLPVPVKPSLAEDVQDLVSPSPSRIPTLTTVQQVKYQRPVLSDFSAPVDVWLRVSPPSHRCSKLPQSSSHIHTHTLAPTCIDRSCGHTPTHTDRDATDLATVVGLLATPLSKSPPLLLPVTFPPSLCLVLSVVARKLFR